MIFGVLNHEKIWHR